MENHRKIYSIQALRAIAAGFVVLLHAQGMAEKLSDSDSILNGFFSLRHFGSSGVDIFFVISGFIMTVVSARNFSMPGVSMEFFKRRLVRIIPMYWFYTSVMLLMVCLPFTLKQSVFDLSFTIRSYLLIPSVNPSSQEIMPLVAQGWTLSYEMYFYVLFAFFLLFKRNWFLPSITLLFTACIAWGLLVDVEKDSTFRLFTNPILMEFILGCFIGTIYVSGRHPGPLASVGLVGLGCLGLMATIILGKSGFTRVVDWGLPAACLVAGAVNLERTLGFRTPRVMIALGDSSYTLYLSHTFVLMVMGKLLKKGLLSGIPIDIIILFSVGLCLALGHLAYLCIEKPVTRFFTRRRMSTTVRQQPVTSP